MKWISISPSRQPGYRSPPQSDAHPPAMPNNAADAEPERKLRLLISIFDNLLFFCRPIIPNPTRFMSPFFKILPCSQFITPPSLGIGNWLHLHIGNIPQRPRRYAIPKSSYLKKPATKQQIFPFLSGLSLQESICLSPTRTTRSLRVAFRRVCPFKNQQKSFN